MNTTDTIQDNEKRAALEQVLTSATFVRATQVRNFLRYICEMELRGLGHTLHEYLIGVEALGRPTAYSTDEDSSVRRRAYALRRKLDEVYAHELANASVRIVVPKGSYVPFFVFNEAREVARDSYRSVDSSGCQSSRWSFCCLAVLVPLQRATPAVAEVRQSAPDPVKAKRLAWFHEAKYGLFIHWGLYAIPAGEWKGRRIPGIGEWIMNRAQIPVKEYEQLATQFNPVKFDADEWVQLAQDAGMKYIVITAKHHDGFALYDSKVSKYDIVDATPFKRDVLKELAAACAKQGMRLGFYYSQAQDWHEPNGAGNTWDFLADETKKDFDQYLRDKAEPQVRELLTDYGPVALIWFDTPRIMNAGARAALRRSSFDRCQPNTLIDGRLGMPGDYVTTGRQRHSPRRAGRGVGGAGHAQPHLGIRKNDHDWKSPQTVIFKLIDIVSKGGNYLLNVGPMADGDHPAAESGRSAHGRSVAARQRRGGVRRRAPRPLATSSASRAQRARRTFAVSHCSCRTPNGGTRPGRASFT